MRHFHLDRIVELERGVRAVGVRGVGLNDDVFAEHFPGNPVLPGVYLIEGLAQTAGMLLWESCDHTRIAVMVSVDRARFTSFARPGDTVRLTVEIDSYDDRASVDERQVAVAALTFSMQSPDSVIAPPFLPFWEQIVAVWLGRYPRTSDTKASDA